MPHPTVFFMAYAAYVVAGTACLAVMGVALVQLILPHARRGFPSREFMGQDLVWTVVPALVLVGLTVIGEIPQGWGRAAAGDGAREAWVRSK